MIAINRINSPPATWEVFAPALETAQNIYAKPDATQDEVDGATDTLLNAMLQLRYKADKSVLEKNGNAIGNHGYFWLYT